MKKMPLYLLLSVLFHIFTLVAFEIFTGSELDITGYQDYVFGDVSRPEAIRMAVALNTLAEVERALSEENAPPEDERVVVRFEELESMGELSEALELALTYRERIDEAALSKMQEQVDAELVQVIEAEAESSRARFASAEMSRIEKISAIEELASESKIALQSVQSIQSGVINADAGSTASVQFDDTNTLGSGIAELIDTLSFEGSVESRILEAENTAGVWSHIDSWYVLGPLPSDHAIVKNSGPTEAIEVNLDQVVTDKKGKAFEWNYHWTDGPTLSLENDNSDLVYYFYSELYSEQEQATLIWVRCPKEIRLWVNDSKTPVVTINTEGQSQDFSRLVLKRGYNRLIVRLNTRSPNGYLWVAHSTTVAKAIEGE